MKKDKIHRPRFASLPLYKRKEPHAMHYLSQRVTFWVAIMSVLAFVTGNMMGQHGWHVFWKSVLGGMDDSLIVYTGTVTPVEFVPDYTKWSLYGGNPEDHTYRQVPRDALIPLPLYKAADQQKHYDDTPLGDVYSIGHMGSYETGAEGEGSHPGIDIRVPIGTPIRSISAGFVTVVREDSGGYGKYIVVRHPNVPDPAHPSKTTTLYSIYAHLSSTTVTEGLIVRKGEIIGASGQTGFATGPHLHFQIDREEAPWHPYWPFSTVDMKEAGLSFSDAIDKGLKQENGYLYTVNPLLYVQADYAPVKIVKNESSSSSRKGGTQSLITRREERLRSRLERVTVAVNQQASSAASSKENPLIVERETVVSADTSVPTPIRGTYTGNDRFEVRHDNAFSGRGWESVKITLVDAEGQPVTTAPEKDIYLRTAYGSAEFKPAVLSPLDFEDGEAVVKMLPHGRTTVVIQLQPYGVLSAPMKFIQD